MTLTQRSATLIDFPARPADDAALFIYEHKSRVPFTIERVFVIRAEQACVRGQHAHRACHQLLICLEGRVEVIIDDGKTKSTIILDRADQGLLIPAGLWGQQHYDAGSILMVLASLPYDEADYIRDYDAFLKFAG